MRTTLRKLRIVFRNKEYFSRNINEGPTNTKDSGRSGGKETPNPTIGFIKTVIVFCKMKMAFRKMIIVFRKTDNHGLQKQPGFRNRDNKIRNTFIVYRNKKKEDELDR
jgi:hypothetical protein